jgi:CRISPR-associated endonuclease/helicase Cas3
MITDKGQEWLKKALGLGEGETPFPWQMELLRRFCQGEHVSSLDIPTGLGKTSVMAIWLVARALKAENLPRRLVYVVDRRAVVDQATEVAESLRKWVEADACVACALGLNGRSLPISTLRGQYVDNREWLEDPSSPAIIVGTVDMVGSRLLFSGYGVSRRMRPYHAGLLGVDTLVVLDESHLVPAFEELLRQIEKGTDLFGPKNGALRNLIPPFKLLSLSATGRTQGNSVLRLTEEDCKHDVVRKRLNARKSLEIRLLDEKTKLEDALANHAWTLAGNGRTAVRVLVYADSRDVARKAKEAVEKLAKGNKKQGKPEVKIETELFVGGRRVLEREGAKKRLEELGFLAGSKVERTCPVFLFATSAGEVGVELDADHMVCDLVAWERMVQRLGRVNRRGDGDGRIIVVVEEGLLSEVELREAKDRGDKLSEKQKEILKLFDKRRDANAAGEKLKDSDAKKLKNDAKKLKNYEAQVAQYRALLEVAREGGSLSPKSLLKLRECQPLASAFRMATTPEPLRPALTRPLIDAWAMTSLEKHTGRPDDIQPWLRGWIEDDPPQTRVVWRKYLPVRTEGRPPSRKEIEAFFEAAPPHLSEILETETYRVVDWITARAKYVREEQKQKQEQEQGQEQEQEQGQENNNVPPLRNEDVVAFALGPDGGLREYFTLAKLVSLKEKGDKEEKSEKEKKDEKKKFFGRLAGATLILDARLGGLKDGLLDDKESTLPQTADDDKNWPGGDVIGFRIRSIEASTVVQRDRDWRERFRFAAALTWEGEATRWLIVQKRRGDAATEEDRSVTNPQLLDEHQKWTEVRARRLATALGLDDKLANVLTLAACFHDEGKRAKRWQQAFHAPGDGGVYAKTEGPINYQLLDGYRHELGSLLRIGNNEQIQKLFQKLSEEDRDLVLHLITAHHGFARPVIGTRGCEDAPPSALEEKAAEIALRFARLQTRWGPWGLAWLEALLRAADQQASRDNDAQDMPKEVLDGASVDPR